MAKNKFVALRHQEKTYKGKTYHSYVGSIKVGRQEILLSVNADDLDPVIVEGEFKGKQTHSLFVNLFNIDPKKKDGKRSNEL